MKDEEDCIETTKFPHIVQQQQHQRQQRRSSSISFATFASVVDADDCVVAVPIDSLSGSLVVQSTLTKTTDRSLSSSSWNHHHQKQRTATTTSTTTPADYWRGRTSSKTVVAASSSSGTEEGSMDSIDLSEMIKNSSSPLDGRTSSSTNSKEMDSEISCLENLLDESIMNLGERMASVAHLDEYDDTEQDDDDDDADDEQSERFDDFLPALHNKNKNDSQGHRTSKPFLWTDDSESTNYDYADEALE